MKTSKIIALILACLMLAACIVSCGKTNGNNAESGSETQTASNEKTSESETEKSVKDDITVRVGTLKGPTGMGMAKLMSDSDAGKTEYKYSTTIYSSTDEIVAEVVKGEFDIAAVPSNLAATLFNKTEGKIQVAAVNTLGVLYMLENGDTVKSVSDLKGKTIYATGQGATPEYILNYILEKNGISVTDDVEIIYMQEHSELATQLASGDVAIGMLPEPNVTTAKNKNADLRIALDLTEEWNKVSNNDGVLIQGVLIVNRNFASEHKTVLETFLKEYEASVKYVNENIDQAAELIEGYGIIPNAAIAKKAIPNCHMCFFTAKEYKNELLGFLTALYEQNPKAVGGKLPDDTFFYE